MSCDRPTRHQETSRKEACGPRSDIAVAIPRATFASIVTERLRANIVDGSLKPGSQLSEVELATGFGVSRGPVREALQRLVQEGLLRSESHRGVFVPVLTDEDVLDVYVAREALESAAIRSIISSDSTAAASEALDRFVTRWRRLRRRETGRPSAPSTWSSTWPSSTPAAAPG